jgi:PAS domain-containing protein
MAQQAVETILVRQLAGYLSIPVLVMDTTGTVTYYNEPAERLLGVRFEETGRVSPEEAKRLVEIGPLPGTPDDERAPMEIALAERRPAHGRRIVLRRADGARLEVEVTGFPLLGQGGAMLGAVAMFWERTAR